MKAGTHPSEPGLDRLSTSDEIRAAVELYSGSDPEATTDAYMMIPSDRGGYVKIAVADFECASLVFELAQVIS